MKRWFISRLVSVDGELTPKPGTYPNVNFRVWTAFGKNWCLGQLASANVTRFGSDTDIEILPDATLDLTWNSINSGIRNRVISRMQDAGFDTQGINTSMSVRQVLGYIKLQLQADADVESGDVPDIEA